MLLQLVTTMAEARLSYLSLSQFVVLASGNRTLFFQQTLQRQPASKQHACLFLQSLQSCLIHVSAVSPRDQATICLLLQFGQVGIGSTQDSVATPQLIAALQNDKISQFACGWRHTLALTQQGQMYSWGRGVSGQLGHAETLDL